MSIILINRKLTSLGESFMLVPPYLNGMMENIFTMKQKKSRGKKAISTAWAQLMKRVTDSRWNLDFLLYDSVWHWSKNKFIWKFKWCFLSAGEKWGFVWSLIEILLMPYRLTGQSWLQLQQQKLRARNEQKMRDERDVFERRIHTEITGRPYRSRSSASKRYDGYTSDTTFADEVDYRRPLHVQTPTRSLNDRNYHTLTTTTTTVKERPFVAVRRAHDQAKQQTIVSWP